MLSPNALRILDKLGVLKRAEPNGYKFEKLYFRSEDDQSVDELEFGSAAKYGYTALRVYRFELINALLEMVREIGVPVKYSEKLDKIVSEAEDGVTWLFADGSGGHATRLVGAGGIHSHVRSYIHPGLEPKFTNMLGVTAAIPTSQVEDDGTHPLPVTFMNQKHGAFVIALQFWDGAEVLIGKQYRFTGPESDR